jgi:hypothetical protein
LWSNAFAFTVPVSGGNAVTLAPNLLKANFRGSA